ncbi:hypothetical protein HDU90_000061 [Geranomyces variabilis]|nr:hypothetical protein HDU90_000061 [Geranomyces variabilis]
MNARRLWARLKRKRFLLTLLDPRRKGRTVEVPTGIRGVNLKQVAELRIFCKLVRESTSNNKLHKLILVAQRDK